MHPHKIALITIPKMDLRAPNAGIAHINSILKNNNISSKCYDFNIWLWRKFVKKELGHLWQYDNNLFTEQLAFESIANEYASSLTEYLQECFKSHPPEYLGITIFSIYQFIPLKVTLETIKTNYPGIKIILGGPGISIRNQKACELNLDKLKSLGLYDDYFFGDIGTNIIKYFNEEKFVPGLNNFKTNIESTLFVTTIPDYTDFNFSDYPKKHLVPSEFSSGPNNWIYITGSKGCVKSCNFCDVASFWPKFKSKSGKQIAKEMIHQHQTSGVDKFRFTDSLLNGDLKVLEELCNELVSYPHKLLWHGQYICRSKNQQSKEFYDLMSNAGLDLVSIGIESGSQKVRFDMNKKFDDESLYFTMDQLARVKIKLVPLMIVGFPTETEIDFKKTLHFLGQLNNYNNIVDVNLNNPFRVLPGSPIGDNPQKYGIHGEELNTDYDFTSSWSSKEVDYHERICRFFRFHNQLLKLNIKRSYAGNDLEFYKNEFIKIMKVANESALIYIDNVCKGIPNENDQSLLFFK